MKGDDLKHLDNNDRIKEVGRRWREIKPAEKKKYEMRKETEERTYKKLLAKYKRVSFTAQFFYVDVIRFIEKSASQVISV